ncbi:MAG: hypothetical protein P8I83_10910, partial [Paracoccaceae bacterium]|nr:hypothetical protein [Paracoccaceae bacterium]
KRLPIPINDIRKVQEQCRFIDDDMRSLVTLVSDTGLRLAEAAGLLKSDLVLDTEIPFVRVRVHPWRAVKTSSSVELVVPLFEASLWAARRILNANPDSVYAFPRYNKTSLPILTLPVLL